LGSGLLQPVCLTHGFDNGENYSTAGDLKFNFSLTKVFRFSDLGHQEPIINLQARAWQNCQLSRPTNFNQLSDIQARNKTSLPGNRGQGAMAKSKGSGASVGIK